MMRKIMLILILSILTFLCMGQASLYTKDSIEIPDYTQGFLISDNCLIVDISQTPLPGTFFTKSNSPFTVTIIASDAGGNQASIVFDVFIFDPMNTFLDSRDSTIYPTVIIGDQMWMAKNLTYLPYVTITTDISKIEPYQYVFDYRGTDVNAAKATNNYKELGVLYNYSAAINVCPDGWHLPSDDEWKQLETYLGMASEEVDGTGWRGIDQGSKLKEIGVDHWYEPNNQADNISGFSAIPGGYFSEGSHFTWTGSFGEWWTSTEYTSDTEIAFHRVLHFTSNQVYRQANFIEHGFSVRCLKD